MDIPRRYFGHFFDTLVGTPHAKASLKAELSAGVAVEPDTLPGERPHDPYNPYDRLRGAVQFAMFQVIDAAGGAGYPGPGDADVRWMSIYGNGDEGASRLITALNVVGDLYGTHATVPQRRENVQASVATVVGYAVDIARSGAASINIEAGRLGLDPFNPQSLLVLRRRPTSREAAGDFSRAFEFDSDPDGQLTLRTRFKIYKDASRGLSRCTHKS